MAWFLTPEWIEQLAKRASASSRRTPGPAGHAPASSVTLRMQVTGGPDGDVEYHVTFNGSGATITAGPPETGRGAHVVVVQDYATAADISRGDLTPASAFASGRMRLGGQVGMIGEHREELLALGDLYETLRAETTY